MAENHESDTSPPSGERVLDDPERRFRTLVANIPGAVYRCACDPYWTMIFISGAIEPLSGYPAEEFLGNRVRAFVDVILPEDRESVEWGVQEAVEERRPFVLEYRIRHRDGSVRWVYEKGRGILDEAGEVRWLDGVIFNITERKEAERATAMSEAHKSAILQSALDCIITMDAEGRVVEFNPAAERTFGYQRERAVGRPLIDLIIPERLRAKHWAGLARYLSRGEGKMLDRRVEMPAMRADGSEFPAELTITAMRVEGEPYFTGYVRDITERKRTERQLRLRVEQQAAVAVLGLEALAGEGLQPLFDRAIRVVAETLDTELCKLLELQADGERLLLKAGAGWREGLVGRAIVEVNHSTQAGYTLRRNEPVVVEDLSRETRFGPPWLLQEHGAASGMSVIIHNHGGPPWGVLGAHSARPRRFTEEDAQFLQAVANVLAEAIGWHEAQAALRDREAELQKLNAALRRQTEAAERHTDQLRRLTTELTQTEQRERRRLAQVLHDHLQQLLVAAKMRTGAVEVIDEETGGKLRELLEEAIEASRDLSYDLCPPVLYDRGLAAALHWLSRRQYEKLGLTVDVEAELEAEPADPDLQAFLFQSVQELLLNAVKHGNADRVRIEMRGAEGGLMVRVEDNGVGCDPDQMFDGAERGGFGLFSIRERLDMLEGSLSAHGPAGGGCEVTLRLPAKAIAETGGGEAPGDQRGKTPEGSGGEATSEAEAETKESAEGDVAARPIRVMLVDDHKIVREGLAGILRETPDIELVVEAADGREAVEMVDQAKPDVVVMDVSMPRMDGEEATRIIHVDHPEIRLIGLSMHADEGVATAMRSAGATDYIAKDRPVGELLRAIREQAGGQPPSPAR